MLKQKKRKYTPLPQKSNTKTCLLDIFLCVLQTHSLSLSTLLSALGPDLHGPHRQDPSLDLAPGSTRKRLERIDWPWTMGCLQLLAEGLRFCRVVLSERSPSSCPLRSREPHYCQPCNIALALTRTFSTPLKVLSL